MILVYLLADIDDEVKQNEHKLILMVFEVML